MIAAASWIPWNLVFLAALFIIAGLSTAVRDYSPPRWFR